jgi:molybdopterin-guanine dinucleotide biosynthesis protein A
MSSGVAVVILAGGEGTRIGGDKPLLTLGGERLIDRAVQQARQWSKVAAVAVRDPRQVEGCRIEVIRDRKDVEGPLGGLASGLNFARERECQLLLTIPADMPFLPKDLLERLAGALSGYRCSLASSGGHVHPVCGLWSVSAADQLDSYVETGRRSLRGFGEQIGCATVQWPTAPLDPFFNINSPDELAEAERRLTN